ncbi:unnamed protein product, partial [Hapterophycus canaliculatus]
MKRRAERPPMESPAVTHMDILGTLLLFVPEKQFLFFAPVSRSWRDAWHGLQQPRGGRRRRRGTSTARVTRHTSAHQWRYSLANGLRAEGVDWCTAAARVGNLALVKWLRGGKKRHPWGPVTCAAAAGGGHLAVLRWLRENGCPWDTSTCSQAAGGGHLSVLQWARLHGCEWHGATCCSAAERGHRHVLRWARESGCPWDERTCSFAAGGGHLAVLQWARSNGCPWD